MSDLRFVLPEQSAVVISADAAEKLVRSGDGDAALLYIYIIRNTIVVHCVLTIYSNQKGRSSQRGLSYKINKFMSKNH